MIRLPKLMSRRGVSLIEALVALVVIAVGMLALAQVQIQLRFNADLSRQRAEAVRIAQADLEKWRSFSVLGTSVSKQDYAEIASQLQASVPGQENVNTDFQLQRTVSETTAPSYKTLQVTVSWLARNGDTYRVSLESLISRTNPALSGELTTPPESTRTRNPRDRNIRIPTTAIDLGNGKSGFTPPGQSTGYYVFNNTDANIIQYCTGSLDVTLYNNIISNGNSYGGETCETRYGYTIGGFVNFDLRSNVSAVSPGSTVCDFYSDLQSAGLMGSTISPSLALNSVVLDRASFEATSGLNTPREYFINNLTYSSSMPGNFAASIAATLSNLQVTLVSSENGMNSPSIFFSSGAAIVLRVKNGSDVATFTPEGVGIAASGNRNVTRVNANGTTLLTDVLPTPQTVGGTAYARVDLAQGATLAANTVYELVIPAGSITLYQSASKNDTNSSAITLTFSTGTAPVLSTTSPTHLGQLATVADNITLTFDRTVVSGVGNIKILKRGSSGAYSTVETFDVTTGQSGVGNPRGTVTFSGSTVTLNPGADLDAGATYSIEVEPTAVRDGNGFYYAGLTSATFSFATPGAVTASGCPTSTATALNYMEVSMAATSSPSGVQTLCYSDAASAAISSLGTKTIGYFCVLYMTTEVPFSWSGSINLLGPTGWLGGSPRRYTVCRYHDYDNNGTDSNFEHPASYSGVSESITDQNFVVIKKADGNQCPDDTLNVGSQTTNIVIHFNTAHIQP